MKIPFTTSSEDSDTITRIDLKHEKDSPEFEKLPPLEKDPAMKSPIDWGVSTDASKVDEYIYGICQSMPKNSSI